MAALPRSALASGVPSLSSLASTSVSTRLTKKDATERIWEMSCPAAAAFSRPAMYASMTSPCRWSEKISVTLTLIPSEMACVIAGSPSRVAGILMNRFGRSTIHHSARASAMVFAVSLATLGSTSIDTRPSWPAVASYAGRSTSQPQRTS